MGKRQEKNSQTQNEIRICSAGKELQHVNFGDDLPI